MATHLFSTQHPSLSAPIHVPRCIQSFHPMFSPPTGDVILRSNEGTPYCVSSYTLSTMSGLFSSMFSLPQPTKRHIDFPPPKFEAELEEIDTFESDSVLERILCLIHDFPTPAWKSFEEVYDVLNIAEKWDTPGPIERIRSTLSSPQFLHSYPLRIYSLAKHFGWREVAKLASTHTLTLNLRDPIHAPILYELSSKDLNALLNLHQRRRDQFKALLNSPQRFTAGNSSSYHCGHCGVTELDTHTWRVLKNAMFMEMERRPLGDTLGLNVRENEDWPEARACWTARCPKQNCNAFNYDRTATLRQIKNCLDILPYAIED